MFCRPILLCLLNCIAETIQATEGRSYFSRGPHIGQRCITSMPRPLLRCLFFLRSNIFLILRLVTVRFSAVIVN